MKEKIYSFLRDVVYTTAVSYLLISFIVLGMLTLFTNSGDGGFRSGFQAFSYLLGKFFCVFLFSLGLGFLNRIFLWKKNRALVRLVHFFLTLLWFSLTMVLLYLGFFDMNKISARGVVGNLILFLVLYPVCVGVRALIRAFFKPEEKKPYKSILD